MESCGLCLCRPATFKRLYDAIFAEGGLPQRSKAVTAFVQHISNPPKNYPAAGQFLDERITCSIRRKDTPIAVMETLVEVLRQLVSACVRHDSSYIVRPLVFRIVDALLTSKNHEYVHLGCALLVDYTRLQPTEDFTSFATLALDLCLYDRLRPSQAEPQLSLIHI